MVSIERFQSLASEAAYDIPTVFFDKLNGGIVILEQQKLHAQSRPDSPLLVLGEYHHEQWLGRYITLYYGSFMRTFPELSEDLLRKELRKTILHEFRHHLESLSGTHELEEDDSRRLAEYKQRYSEEQ